MVEIERKFLVKNHAFEAQAYDKKRIVQGFLNTDKKRVVRVRIIGDRAFITVKGPSNSSGTSRFEWEKEIAVEDAQNLLKLCLPYPIYKTRYFVKKGKHLFEVDCFENENAGLIVAEIELETENSAFEKPDWLGKEVTGDVRYYNSMLSNNPYQKW
ncbi:MAG: CYTH domain-containing protein [Flavobacteriaceae bacterium]|nr:CYTH domain-containing protein [Flavobacteriaceae bacterium]